jgi:hypothetical protein
MYNPEDLALVTWYGATGGSAPAIHKIAGLDRNWLAETAARRLNEA